MYFAAIPIVMLGPLKLLHETEALDIEFADLCITEIPPHPAKVVLSQLDCSGRGKMHQSEVISLFFLLLSFSVSRDAHKLV